ncbi:MAG: hypothetical protein JWN34_4039 [Bryobacterales bacterium]|nr:hypothetical protein [Bryobacterales bacterium]
MSAFESAREFFGACEAPAGWAGCTRYVVNGAPFYCDNPDPFCGDGSCS